MKSLNEYFKLNPKISEDTIKAKFNYYQQLGVIPDEHLN